MREDDPWDTGDPTFLTAEFAAVNPFLQRLYGEVSAFQAFIAEAEVIE